MIYKQRTYPQGSYIRILEELVISLFDESIRPVIVPPRPFCEKVVVFSSFVGSRYGSFIPEPMIADMFRAVAYKYIGWRYTGLIDQKLSAFVLQRKHKRFVINHDLLVQELQLHYNTSVGSEVEYSLDSFEVFRPG